MLFQSYQEYKHWLQTLYSAHKITIMCNVNSLQDVKKPKFLESTEDMTSVSSMVAVALLESIKS